MSKDINHYDWLENNLQTFFKNIEVNCNNGIISAHGDKCYSYRYMWEEHGIPFPHGVAIFFLTYISPFSKEVRETKAGWVAPDKWVINNYPRFKDFLPPCEMEK